MVTAPDWQSLYRSAEQAVRQERWSEAEPLLRQLLQVVPGHAAAHHLLGKALAARGDLDGAVAAQRRSCELDPALGWNWFALGELLMRQTCPGEAVVAFDQAIATLPAEGWMRVQRTQANLAATLGGERLAAGVGPHTYRYWLSHHERRPASDAADVHQPFWCLLPATDGRQRWQALHAQGSLQPPAAPLGDSIWPCDGWLVLLGPGCTLRPGTVATVEGWLAAGLIQQHAGSAGSIGPDLIYTDEDRIDAAGRRHAPWFKPGWVAESFWSSPWLVSLSIWRMSWLRLHGLALPPSDGDGRFQWLLQALERRPQIAHMPLVLVHGPLRGPRLNPTVLEAHLHRQGEAVDGVIPHDELDGCFRLRWRLPPRFSCSVIIPTRDRADLLERCLSSVWRSTAQARERGLELELWVVDNGSVQPETTVLLQHWRERLGNAFNVLRLDVPFNWSLLNNRAGARARGELLLLLNNDIEARQPGWLEAMAAQALRPRVGCVGALLLYPDGTIQHGGVVVAMHGGADHAYRGLQPDHGVHRGRSRLLTGWGAVTGACLMLRRELLVAAGGFDEGLPVEFNDVDLCLRLGQLGYRHVIPPEAVLIHHESQSRDAHNSGTATAALWRLQQRWPGQLHEAGPWWPAQVERDRADGRPLGLGWMPI